MQTLRSFPFLGAALGFALLSVPANADTTLVDEDFQTDPQQNTTNPTFAGWTYTEPTRVWSKIESSSSDLPGDTNATVNQAIYFEYTSGTASHALTHTWSASDVFTLTFNASSAAWEQTKERWVRPQIRQSDDTILWDPGETSETALGVWDTATDGTYVWNGPGLYGNSTWQAEPETQFSFTINASDFTTGTEGETISLRLASSGQRGVYFDNVQLTLVTEPPAGQAFALTITPATAPDTGFDLAWESQVGKLYNLRTSTDLAGAISTWDLVAGGDNIEATPPTNTTHVDPAGARRFYAVEEFDVPPPAALRH